MTAQIYQFPTQSQRTAEGIIQHEAINREVDLVFTDIVKMARELQEKQGYEQPR